jgi:hypothetical protein
MAKAVWASVSLRDTARTGAYDSIKIIVRSIGMRFNYSIDGRLPGRLPSFFICHPDSTCPDCIFYVPKPVVPPAFVPVIPKVLKGPEGFNHISSARYNETVNGHQNIVFTKRPVTGSSPTSGFTYSLNFLSSISPVSSTHSSGKLFVCF